VKILAVALLLSPLALHPLPALAQAPYPSEEALVERAVDGDTVVLSDGRRVRYIGVDTPETHHPRKPVEFMGREAKNFNRRLVEGQRVRLEFDVDRDDRYHRLLAYVYLADGTFVNAELVKQGYAQIMTIPPNVKHADLFLKLQQEAREAKRGLWGRK
jgi:micrococcal nuclease